MALIPVKPRTLIAISALLLFFTLITSLQAQERQEDDKVTEGVKKYACYIAWKGETAFSIARKFNLPLEDFFKNNPRSKQGIHEGDELMIPIPFSIRKEDIVNKGPQRIKYVVGRRETLYSIARMFNTTQEEILKVNPSVKGILSKGTALNIPLSLSDFSATPTKKAEISSREYTIASGDNYYQLQKRFGISQADLEKLNPVLKDGFKSGMIIKIPSKKSTEVETVTGVTSPKAVPASQKPSAPNEAAGVKTNFDQINNVNEKTDNSSAANTQTASPVSNKVFKIGIFLPFCQNLNDSVRIIQHTNSFLEFYSGVLMATEKITGSGMKVKLFVYDTYRDSDVINKLIKKPEFLSLDLIIGPVYPKDQKIVTELSAKNFIPMISPLSADSRFVSTTPGYYLINPGRKLRLASTAEYISANFSGQNIIMLNHGAESADEKYLLSRLNQKTGTGKVKQYNILTEESSGLEELLKADKENIFILAEDNEANVSVSMTRLNTISKSHKIKVIGLQEYTKMKSIDVEYLHNTNLHYLAPYFIDYGNPKVNTFIEKYRTAYNSEPTQYSFQGYDIGLYFISSLGKSGRIFKGPVSNPGVDLLQAEYNFQKPSPYGGHINRTLYVIEYTNSYEIRSVEKIRASVDTDHREEKEIENSGLDQ